MWSYQISDRWKIQRIWLAINLSTDSILTFHRPWVYSDTELDWIIQWAIMYIATATHSFIGRMYVIYASVHKDCCRHDETLIKVQQSGTGIYMPKYPCFIGTLPLKGSQIILAECMWYMHLSIKIAVNMMRHQLKCSNQNQESIMFLLCLSIYIGAVCVNYVSVLLMLQWILLLYLHLYMLQHLLKLLEN